MIDWHGILIPSPRELPKTETGSRITTALKIHHRPRHLWDSASWCCRAASQAHRRHLLNCLLDFFSPA